MIKPLLLTALLAWSGTTALGYQMKSFRLVGNAVQPVLAWCDAPGRVLMMTPPGDISSSAAPATLLQRVKSGGVLQPAQSSVVSVGPAEGAAGSTYYPFRFTPTPGGKGYVQVSNVENTIDPAYRMTRVSRFQVNASTNTCRYQPQAVFMGVTTRHTIIIWHSGNSISYASRNHDGTPGVFITGGTVGLDDSGPEYTFTSGAYQYLVKYHEFAAFISIYHGGQLIRTDKFVAYSFSTPHEVQP